MDFITYRYEIIENRYVLVTILKNMQLVAEIRFYPLPEGDEVVQGDNYFVYCSDDDLMEEIFDKANELAREHKLIDF